MRELHMSNMVRRYCNAMSADRKAHMEEKVTAESIFKGKKSSYSARVRYPFRQYTEGMICLDRPCSNTFRSNYLPKMVIIFCDGYNCL